MKYAALLLNGLAILLLGWGLYGVFSSLKRALRRCVP